MERQRNRPQIKERTKEILKELIEMEATEIPKAEFKTMVRRMLSKLRGRMDYLRENLNKEVVCIKKDIKTIKKTQSEMKTTVSEMKTTLEGMNSRSDEAKV